MDYWSFLKTDNEPQRIEALQQKTRLFTLLENHCVKINELVGVINKLENDRMFATIQTDHEDEWPTSRERVKALLESIQLYLARTRPSLVGLLDTKELYEFSSDDAEGVGVLSYLSNFRYSPLQLVPGYLERYRLSKYIQEMKETIDKMEPAFDRFNKSIIKVAVRLEMGL